MLVVKWLFQLPHELEVVGSNSATTYTNAREQKLSILMEPFISVSVSVSAVSYRNRLKTFLAVWRSIFFKLLILVQVQEMVTTAQVLLLFDRLNSIVRA